MDEIDDPYFDGWESYKAGLQNDTNPFDPSEDEFWEWNDGYLAAEEAGEELYNP